MEQPEAVSRFADTENGGNILQPGVFSRFANPDTEVRYIEASRALRLPFVRLYCVIFMAVALAYSVINPMFAKPGDGAQLAVLVGATLAVSGAYIASTWWEYYYRHQFIDFAALLALSVICGQINAILADQLIAMGQASPAIFTINRLILTAFAAVVLAGSPRMFIGWLALDILGWFALLMPSYEHSSAFTYALLSYMSGAVVMLSINLAVGRTSRAAFALAEGFDLERQRNEELVFNMLPRAAVQRIREGCVVADSYSDVSVVFIDLVGFSALARRVSPGHLVELLNAFFKMADQCAERHQVEKVKTVGDCYLAIAGGNVSTRNCADAAIAFATDVISRVEELREKSGVSTVGLRAGIHSGPVVGGVIGETRMAYDYWGDTVNVAARLEALAPINGLAISEATWLRTRERTIFEEPQETSLKGVGDTLVYRAEIAEREKTQDKPQDGAIKAA
ncbi:adenylate/guanylate cyclase domain-containing protein [Alteraurantiacibacter aquimixticola]|uniref:adenylate/guanylate cyclase domain-containing protein n=1 Tax=Alteraurantiacibacter aquimixticola TaxID=2489173 RepID=UPI00145BAC69|nr:adenylate/guanylate cyclase domain-containing protein [Alteraurantiacibacter aquimixticola]